MSEYLIFIERAGDVERLLRLSGGDARDEGMLLVDDMSLAGRLKSRGFNVKTPADYGFSGDDLWQAGMDWYYRLAGRSLADGRNIKELLTHRGLSLWWLVEQPLFVSRFACPSVMDKIQALILMERVISLEKPRRVCFVDSGSPAASALAAVSRSRGIDAIGIRAVKSRFGPPLPRIKAPAYIYGQWLRAILRCVCWKLMRHEKPGSSESRRTLLAFSCCVWSNIRDGRGNLRPGEPHLDSVFEQLGSEMRVLDVDVPSGGWGLGLMREKARQTGAVYRPFESYLSMPMVFKSLGAARGLRRGFGRLRRHLDRAMEYNGVDAAWLMKANFSQFFSTGYLALMLTFIEMAARMLAAEKPAVIVHYGDMPETGRAVMGIAGERHIPVILLQHGLYEEKSHYFNHSPGDIGPNQEASAPYCPVPDYSVVSDAFTRKILVERGRFPEESVLVWGQPRYDAIAAGGRACRVDLMRRLRLSPGRKLVIWLTASHAFSLQENREYIDSVYRAVGSFTDVSLVVKLHPAENQHAALYLGSPMLRPVIIGRSSLTTLELIAAADAVITNGWCSTGIEAIMADKPVIALGDGRDAAPYVVCGAALEASEPESVLRAMGYVLHNDDTGRSLADGRRRFIDRFGLVTDGEATRRFVGLVKRLAESRVNP